MVNKLRTLFLENVSFYESEEEYRADNTAVSAHFLMSLAKNDIYGFKNKENMPLYYSPFAIGHLAEELTFTPDVVKDKYEVIEDFEELTGRVKELADLVIREAVSEIATEKNLENIAETIVTENKFWGNWGIEKKKAQYDLPAFWNYIKVQMSGGKVLTAEDYNKAKVLSDKFRNNFLLNSLKKEGYELYYHPRLKITGIYSFDIKLELDLLAVLKGKGETIVDIKIIDLKSTQNSVVDFISKDYFYYKLYIQSAFYKTFVSKVLNVKLFPNLVNFYFLVASKRYIEEPAYHIHDVNDVVVWKGFEKGTESYEGMYHQLNLIQEIYDSGINIEEFSEMTIPIKMLLPFKEARAMKLII